MSLKAPKEGTDPERFELLEEDVNAWTEVVVKSKKRLGVKNVEVDFRPGNWIGATAQINMDEVELTGFSISVFKSMLSGIQTLEAVGKLEIQGTKGTYTVEEASFNGVSVPAWVVNQVISALSSRQPPHVDITEPFDLPFGVTGVRMTANAVEILR
ncbi:MAG: hypothetical protein JSU96_00380 [Acidobacteriota bacterium]|nr:MAG: hypothetical protein JSU96_00380 [Acidobacteriota bacterium]